MAAAPQSPGRRLRRWLYIVGGLLLLLVCGLITAFAFLPAAEDPPIPYAQEGGGAHQRAGAINGLQASWPDLPAVDPQQAALGKLLFYDPVLSANKDLSCASCHHPDLGFGDGRPVAQGSHGQDLRRNAPSLWNVAYRTDILFWDGRAHSLEEQMLVPLTSENEMAANVDDLMARLRAIPQYKQMFGQAFPDGLTLDNVTHAIAAFERTLISKNSPFDQFAVGNFDALTPTQRRGFNVFRSAQTACFECHTWPTFASNNFAVLGVPDRNPLAPDLGQVEVLNAPDATRAFRIPSLRNIALTGPYMHNGVFTTLDEVVQFYAKGGGPAFGVDVPPDEFIQGFNLTSQQTSDLIAFLFSLTDEPPDLISIPESVPSGLPVVQHIENPARAQFAQVEAPITTSLAAASTSHTPQTITVQAGDSIQAAVDQAQPGDTVLVQPGVYHETVYVDTPGITIQGVVTGNGTGDNERPWLDGQGTLSDGFNTSGDNFVIQGFGMRNYIGNGILTTNAAHVVYRDLIIQNAGIYGIYPVLCTDVLIENVTASGITDAALYVGQSRGPIVVRNNEVFENQTGIEIENSTNAEVYNNHAHDNVAGILVFLLPNNPSKVGYGTRVYDNFVENNNHVSIARPNAIVGDVPPGTGILMMTADSTEVFHNTIRGNQTGGVGVTSLYELYPRDTVFDLGPIPENNWIHDNTYEHNGYDPQGLAKELGIPGSDVLWTGDGWNNAFDEAPSVTRFPPVLPGRGWPDPARRAIWRMYSVLIQALL